MTDLLLVEDDHTLRLALVASLRSAGFEVVAVATGSEALAEVDRKPPSVIVLDLGLPDMDGADVLSAIRERRPTPILVLTARHDRDDKLALLRAGADDYVTKPFDTDEVMARLEAILRRATDPAPRRLQVDGDLVVDLDRAAVHRGTTTIVLTPTELRLLDALISGGGRLLRHDELLRTVWGEAYGTESEYLRTFVAQLRRKLGDDAARPRLIRTHPGIGYRWIGGTGGSISPS